MSRTRLSQIVSVAAATMLLWAGPAAALKSQVVADCNAHGQLTQHYSLQQLKGALAAMPPTVQEYTNCYDVIQRQLLNQLGSTHESGGGSNDKSGGSFLPMPVIVLLAVLLAAAGGYTVLAVRRRGGGGGPDAS